MKMISFDFSTWNFHSVQHVTPKIISHSRRFQHFACVVSSVCVWWLWECVCVLCMPLFFCLLYKYVYKMYIFIRVSYDDIYCVVWADWLNNTDGYINHFWIRFIYIRAHYTIASSSLCIVTARLTFIHSFFERVVLPNKTNR